MNSDVRSKRLTASGAVTDARTRIRGVYISGSGTAGNLKLRDGGASGTIMAEFDIGITPTPVYVQLPGHGTICQSSIYAEISNLTSATVFYG